MKGYIVKTIGRRKWIYLFIISLLVLIFYAEPVFADGNIDELFQYEVTGDNNDEIRILRYVGNAKNVTIPDKINRLPVTELAESAFYNNKIIEQVFFAGKNINFIGEEAFYGCSNLVYVDFKSTVITELADTAFRECTKLNNIYLPDTLTKIGERVFDGCTSLNSIFLGKNTISIGQMAFANCTGLKEIRIPKSVKQIWSQDKLGVYGGVFYGCSSLESVEFEGNNITKIPDNTFYGCSKLSSIDLPNSVTEIGARAFFMCIKLNNINLSNQLTTIGKGAFYLCRSLASITFPESLIDIQSGVLEEENTFGGCTRLKSIVFGSKIKTIQPYTFYGCSGLTSVTLPESMNLISTQAFGKCSSLSSVYSLGDIPTIQDNSFYGSDRGLTFYYQNGYSSSVADKYKKKDFEKSRNHIVVYYNNNDGNSGIQTAYGESGKTISEPIPPTKKGHSFIGWFNLTSNTFWNFSTNSVKSSVTLVAQWQINKYNILFNTQGGSLVNTNKDVFYESKLGALPVPTRSDYEFIGWFTDVNGSGSECTKDTLMKDNDMVLYAKWKLNPTPPETPVIQVSENAPTQVKILWNQVSNITGYDIYRATSYNGRYTLIGSASSAATGYINKRLVKGKTYYYRVKAYKSIEGQKFYSGYSPKMKIKLISRPAQAKLSAKKKSTTSTDLTWGKVVDADGYEVFFKTKSSDKFKKFAEFKGNVLGCYHTKLAKNKNYYYTVRAYTIVGGQRVYGKAASSKLVKL